MSNPILNPREEATNLLKKSLADSVKGISVYFTNEVSDLKTQIDDLKEDCIAKSAVEVLSSIDDVTKSVAEFRLNMASQLSSIKEAAKVVKTLQGPSEEEKAARSAYNKQKRLERLAKEEAEKAA